MSERGLFGKTGEIVKSLLDRGQINDAKRIVKEGVSSEDIEKWRKEELQRISFSFFPPSFSFINPGEIIMIQPGNVEEYQKATQRINNLPEGEIAKAIYTRAIETLCARD